MPQVPGVPAEWDDGSLQGVSGAAQCRGWSRWR